MFKVCTQTEELYIENFVVKCSRNWKTCLIQLNYEHEIKMVELQAYNVFLRYKRRIIVRHK